MDKDLLLKQLRSLSNWEEMIKHGKACVCFEYKGVVFLLFRNDASHYLSCQPKDTKQKEIIIEFNNLMEKCREDIKKEMEVWDQIRQTRED